MDLRTAATWFDQTVCSDAYGADTFLAQLEPLDYYKLDGASVKRRIMSTGPDVVLPSRMTVRIDNQVYLVGESTPEHFEGALLRNRYVMSGADDLATVRSMQQVLQQAGGAEVWSTIVFTKISSDERFSSLPVAEFRVFLGPQESLNEHDIVLVGNDAYLVTAPYMSDSGLMSGVAVRLEYPVPEDGVYWTATYDPVLDTNTESGTNVKIIRLRWAQDFAFLDEGTPKYAHGDMTMIALSSAISAPKPNERITVSGGEWRVVSGTVVGGITRLHMRRA